MIDATARKVVGDFDSTMFWTNRGQAGDLLKEAIKEKLKEVFTDVLYLQITNVNVSDKRELALINTQVTQ